MTPDAFIKKWQGSTLKERSAAQEHFIDLCALLDEPTPAAVDPSGEWYTFERGAKKTGGGDGWADVWKRHHFAWEYKGKSKDLGAALRQLQQYALALESPPLLIVSDMDTIEIHTSFTNTRQEAYVLTLEDLADVEKRQWLKWAFTDPERLRPGETREQITAKASERFAELAHQLREAGHDRLQVAHFVSRLLFCMFAEDIGILPKHLFSQMLKAAKREPDEFQGMASDLFRAMHKGGRIGYDKIEWFNGGLFDGDEALPLTHAQIETCLAAAHLDWSAIEPSILGTLFERGMDPAKRSQLGAHYTDPATIQRLVDALIVEPLEAEWSSARAEIESHLAVAAKQRQPASRIKKANAALQGFLLRLRDYTVLDPACGSGNFLYLALKALKDFEHRVSLEAEQLGLHRALPEVGVKNVRGIELNQYAAELARVTLWIGEIQWMIEHGYSLEKNPILKPLEQIEQRDALVDETGGEAAWPAADVIIGNPPFLGNKKLLRELGDEAVARIRAVYEGRVPHGVDLVAYWFEKARAQIEQGQSERAGLVATNSIRGGVNRRVLEQIRNSAEIYFAWSDEPWINEGAAVRVSLLAFSAPSHGLPVLLDGSPVDEIYADLTGGSDGAGVDLTRAKKLPTNTGVAFVGGMKKGRFDVPGAQARAWLLGGGNPNGRPNSDVLFPWVNGLDVTRRKQDKWIVDFGDQRPQAESAQYEGPFAHVVEQVKPARDAVRNARERENWWLHARSAPDLREAIEGLERFIVTARVAKHRLFVWMSSPVVCDGQLVVVARDDDTSFGILHSRFHELWALRMGTHMGVGNDLRYTPTSTFETFPFPPGLEPDRQPHAYENAHIDAIAAAAAELNALRESWLNPPEWVERVPEVVEGYPDRIVPRAGREADLKKRTLTRLYNERPAWLDLAHERLDAAVAQAYGWEWPLSDEEVLRRLLALNQAGGSRAQAGGERVAAAPEEA